MNINRDRKYGRIEMQYRDAAAARLHSVTLLKTSEVVILSTYLERRICMVNLEGISPGKDAALLLDAILLSLVENVVVFQVTYTTHKSIRNDKGRNLSY